MTAWAEMAPRLTRKSGHGFTSSKPVSMVDTRTMKLLKTIDVGAAAPDGILFDSFNERVYVLSHPTKNATVIDANDGSVVGTIDLGGTRPSEGIADGKGMLYVVSAGYAGQRHRRRRKDHEGCRALSLVRRHRRMQWARSRREKSRALRRLPVGYTAGGSAAAEDGNPRVLTTGRSLPPCRLQAVLTARSSIRRGWKPTAPMATAR